MESFILSGEGYAQESLLFNVIAATILLSIIDVMKENPNIEL